MSMNMKDIVESLLIPSGWDPSEDPHPGTEFSTCTRLVIGYMEVQCRQAAMEIERLRDLLSAATNLLEPQDREALRAKALECVTFEAAIDDLRGRNDASVN